MFQIKLGLVPNVGNSGLGLDFKWVPGMFFWPGYKDRKVYLTRYSLSNMVIAPPLKFCHITPIQSTQISKSA